MQPVTLGSLLLSSSLLVPHAPRLVPRMMCAPLAPLDSVALASMSYRELQQACKARGLGGKGKAVELRERLEKAVDVDFGSDAGIERSELSDASPAQHDALTDLHEPELLDDEPVAAMTMRDGTEGEMAAAFAAAVTEASSDAADAMDASELGEEMEALLAEQCDTGNEAACETLSRAEEAKKAWQARGVPTFRDRNSDWQWGGKHAWWS